jgi:glycosyltransferase involved in cell wall biosynthesis
MKILINRKIVEGPYGGGNNFVKNLYTALKSAGHELVSNLQSGIDLIVLHDPRYDELGISIREIAAFKRQFPKTKLLHRINECDARKNTNEIDQLLLISNQLADETVFISEWLRDYFISKGFAKQSHIIYNGCDLSHFYPQKNKNTQRKPVKIVTHHWSDNWMKGFDVYKYIDELCGRNPEKYQFTYVGRYAKEYKPKYTTIVPPTYGKNLGDELRNHDIYVTASRWEPCGMHHIEGAASGLPVLYHKDGGGIVEGCKKHGIEFSSVEELPHLIDTMNNDYDSFSSKIDYSFLSFERCMKQYLDLIEKMGNDR